MRRRFRSLAARSVMLALVAAFSLPHSTFAISISPPEIEAENVLRGVSQTKSIRVGRLPSETGDLTVKVSARGDYASYLIFEPSFVIPAGQDAVEFEFQINGGSASSGTYQVPLTFSLIPTITAEEGTAVVGILAGATAMINFTVSGEEVVGYSFLSLGVSDLESDDHPYATFTVMNTGNVDWRPERVDLTFTNQLDATSAATASIEGSTFELIGPGETSEQILEIKQTLPEGAYTLSADVVGKDASTSQLVSQQFSVFAPGTLKQSAQLLSVTSKKSVYEFGEKILLEGTLLNDGQVPVTGTLMTEVYKDGEYIDLLTGEEAMAGIGEEVEVTQIFEPQEAGAYTFTTYAKYANRKTQTFDLDVTVNAGASTLSFLNSSVGLAALVAAFLIPFGFIAWRRRHARGVVQPTAAPLLAPAPLPAAPVSPPSASVQTQPPVTAVPDPVQTPSSSDEASRRW